MGSDSHLSKHLKRSLLLKIIAQNAPKKEDIFSVIELTANKAIEDLKALTMTIYLLEGNDISFKYVYYSPTLWKANPSLQKKFDDKRTQLLALTLPAGTGIVGKVIQTGESHFFNQGTGNDKSLHDLSDQTSFKVTSMLTVPLKTKDRTIGAMQFLNKEPEVTPDAFTPDDQHYLEELSEYTTPLLMRIVDPNYQMDDNDTAKYIAYFTDTPLITDISTVAIEDNFLQSFDVQLLKQLAIIPYKRLGDTSVAAIMANPLDYQSRESFSSKTQYQVDEAMVASRLNIDKLLRKYFPKEFAGTAQEEDQSTNISELSEKLADQYAAEEVKLEAPQNESVADDDSPLVALVNRCIEDAFFSGASDIHIEPQENRLLIRYRIDGVCVEKMVLPKAATASLVARIKIMCDLDIAQKRLPQDGRIAFSKYTKKNINIDLRVATCPSLHGEKVVMRILDKTKTALPITALGFSEENLTRYRKLIQYPYGMILHCGPTGSGKSMTLFSALAEIISPEINIQTAEDPVEYTVPGINQVQMHKSIGLTFAAALRSFLRMDPDIILVGEIRDQETAEIAIEAALTGHLLLSTLHTNDAPSTIARFTDMEIEPFMISSSLLVVCAQRLIRRVCKKCRISYVPVDNEAEILKKANMGWKEGQAMFKANEHGCPLCGGSGMRGRTGIHELMENTEELTRAINQNANTATLKKAAMQSGMKTLHQDSLLKAQEGTTTITEALANIPPD